MIRPAERDDAEAIAAIWNDVIRNTAITFTTAEKTPRAIRADIYLKREAGQGFFVYEDAGIILGFATYFPFRNGPGYAHTMEHSINLAAAARGRGIGRALMSVIEGHARARGVHSMIAGVSGENSDGAAFHSALGYTEVARLPEVGRKFGRWMDLIVMQKML
ncbi:GNAT family N-acetyltransferase [Parasulfitobacter algicola]|uniref:N-acetyltransferase family protein n=1 Tax=Parasulfitobacter algicola TaxID=2614809 RepID=A0ABX2IYX1_9RHOB|nr:GNAT family N-acetyltransferase [Sulfitobacter algicola]NSX56515.1 N-acetyltransferase family protein [Sulfitobacter algicola]